jgi:hypothetical protein
LHYAHRVAPDQRQFGVWPYVVHAPKSTARLQRTAVDAPTAVKVMSGQATSDCHDCERHVPKCVGFCQAGQCVLPVAAKFCCDEGGYGDGNSGYGYGAVNCWDYAHAA